MIAKTSSKWAEHLPGYDPWRDSKGYTFDEVAANRALEFFWRFLKHSKGPHAGQPFSLEPWQESFIGNLFGWKDSDGLRRYRESLLFVARKNGKTTLAAGIALFLLTADHEPGAEVYSAAADREQAALVFEQAKQMVLTDGSLDRICECFKRSIVHRGSFYKAISSDANTKHGYNVHGCIIDELHAHQNRDLVDVLLTGTGARRQPLTVHLTTAGHDRTSICYEKYNYACQVRDGVICDPAFLPAVYESDPADDWQDEATWRKANPNYGVSIRADYLAKEAEKAKAVPSYENTFRRLHLNQWTEQADRWLQMDAWTRCKAVYSLDDLKGETCYAGLDLSSTADLTALVLVFPGDQEWRIWPICFVPGDNAAMREKVDSVPYLAWARQGALELTHGTSVDYDAIKAKLYELREIVDIRKIGCDRWNAAQLVNDLTGEGFVVEYVTQGFSHMSGPSKELERRIMAGLVEHPGNPVLDWCANNVALKRDHNDNIRPDKKTSSEKIDLIVAAVMGIAVAINDDEDEGPSVYEERGFVSL